MFIPGNWIGPQWWIRTHPPLLNFGVAVYFEPKFLFKILDINNLSVYVLNPSLSPCPTFINKKRCCTCTNPGAVYYHRLEQGFLQRDDD